METTVDVEVLNPENEQDKEILNYTQRAATQRKRNIILGLCVIVGLFVIVNILVANLSKKGPSIFSQ